MAGHGDAPVYRHTATFAPEVALAMELENSGVGLPLKRHASTILFAYQPAMSRHGSMALRRVSMKPTERASTFDDSSDDEAGGTKAAVEKAAAAATEEPDVGSLGTGSEGGLSSSLTEESPPPSGTESPVMEQPDPSSPGGVPGSPMSASVTEALPPFPGVEGARLVELWENQRYYPLKGWSTKLLPTDRWQWSDKTGRYCLRREALLLPTDWEWVDGADWAVDKGEGSDADGWYYGVDFTQSIRSCNSSKGWKDCVRRRKWQRPMVPRPTGQPLPLPPEGKEHGYWSTREHYGFPAGDGEINLWTFFPQAFSRLSEDYIAWTGFLAQEKFALTSREAKFFVRDHGVPSAVRGRVWFDASGASKLHQQNPGYYKSLVENTSQIEADLYIQKDLNRTFPSHPWFVSREAQKPLRRVLRALALRNQEIGYVQSFNFIASVFLLNMPEEAAFWTMVALLERILPRDFYNSQLAGLNVDCVVLDGLVEFHLPTIHTHLVANGLDLKIISAGWLVSQLVNVFPLETTLRVWDCVLVEGSTSMIHRIILAFLKTLEATLLREALDTSTFMELIQNQCARQHDFMRLLKTAIPMKFKKHQLEEYRSAARSELHL
eukprot:TRINITY_DN14437_c0_g1_i1.p1 TRINITY_DN14437_c0_g1~~TRINITY_DN14437_c0_g1_i1.p1  ORF type:complete len:607 (+),score=70.69 TRINITY_DN14437_c0_g1_i1:107-1927(+)